MVRHYRPALRENQQAAYADYQIAEAKFRQQQASIRSSIQQTFLIKKASEAGLTIQPRATIGGGVRYVFPVSLIRSNQAEFNQLYMQLRRVQIDARHTGVITYDPATGRPILPEARRRMLEPGGDYEQTLVALGRRKPNEDFLVGMSPDSRGGYSLNDYITTQVIPYYS